MTRLLAPRYWGGHLLMLLAVAAATALGFWQLHAWQQHRHAASEDLSHAKPVALSDVMGGDDPFPGDSLGRPVTFSGRWLSHGTVYISGREQAGRTGYWVVSPLLVDGTRSAMPVVRGWSARPDAPQSRGATTIEGWLEFGEGSGATDPDPGDDVLPELRIASLVSRVPADLYSGYVIARTANPGDATATLSGVGPTDVPTPSNFTALRNFLYAIQWWVFALFAIVVWARWCRDVVNPPDPAELVEADGAEGGPSGRTGQTDW